MISAFLFFIDTKYMKVKHSEHHKCAYELKIKYKTKTKNKINYKRRLNKVKFPTSDSFISGDDTGIFT